MSITDGPPITSDSALDQNDLRELQVLEVIENDARISQRGLADKLGIALGLTNSILRRLVRKGLVKTRALPANRLAYYITPQGFSEKAAPRPAAPVSTVT